MSITSPANIAKRPDATLEVAWKRVVRDFEVLFETSESVGELRRTLRSLAVCGLLVAQTRSEGTGRDLLPKLKADVVAADLTWTDPAPEEIAADAGIVAPPSWAWVRLSNVITFGPKNGYSPRTVSYHTKTRTLTLTATTSGRFNGEHTKYVDETVPSDSWLWLEDGDILIQRANTIDYVGMAAVYRGPAHAFIYPDLMMKLRVSRWANVDYAHLVLLAHPTRSFFQKRATGTAGSMPKINQTVVSSTPIPLPPLAEQKRIVSKVDQLMALCDDLEAKQTKKREIGNRLTKAALGALTAAESPEEFKVAWRRVGATFSGLIDTSAALGELKQTIVGLAVRGFLVAQDPSEGTAEESLRSLGSLKERPNAATSAFGSVRLPASWCWATFTEVATIDSNLVDPKMHLDLPHVAPDNIEKGTGRLLEYRSVREDGVTSGKHHFFAGHVLYSKIRPNLSKVVIVDFEGLCSADMYPLGARINARYLQVFLLSDVFLRQVVRNDNRIAMPKVNQQQLSVTLVAVPPLAEQKRIVAKVDQLMALCGELELKLRVRDEKATKLAEALVARAISA